MTIQTDFTIEQLRKLIEPYVSEPMDEISDDDYLLDAGIDSITIMSVVEELRQQGILVTFIQMADHPSIKAWHGLIKEQLAK
ncbi:MAG: phosphopantetheine-binding protein [Lysinibacillus sp.]